MTPARRVRRAQAVLVAAAGASAVLWGGCGAATVLVTAGAADLWIGLGRPLREVVPAMAWLCGLVAFAAAAWRYRRVTSLEAVSLWIEERRPELGFALVTALEPRMTQAPLMPLIPQIGFVGTALSRGLRAAVPPVVGLVAAVATLGALPDPIVRRVTAARPGDALDRPARGASPLASIVATVTPPRYTRLPPQVNENPSSVVVALVGSDVTVEGVGPAPKVVAERTSSEDIGPPAVVVAERTGGRVPVATAGGRWTAAFVMPDSAVVLELTAGLDRRVVAFDPVPDSVPVVRIVSPARDTVLREARGTVRLLADARDDFGLESVWFELIMSSGEGESFTFRSLTLGRGTGAGKTGAAHATLLLDSLGLGPGDVVHLRAAARDGNTVSGPGLGVSETRTFRVARAGEYDTTAVVTLPPIEPDTSALSQRMLIMLAEALAARHAQLARDAFVRESQAIGHDQTRLRRRVAEIVFMRLGGEQGEHGHDAARERAGGGAEMTPAELLAAAEAAAQGAAGEALDFHGDETPVVAINRPLLEAYNAMWDAARELNTGEPARALPHMHAALDAIQRARAAERIYLRGRPAPIVVDVARVRLQGKRDDARPVGAPASQPGSDSAAPWRVERIIALAIAGNPAAADSALVLRAAVLAGHPALAAALAEVSAALREARDATDALLRARRAVQDEPRARGTLAPWGVGW